MNKINQYIKNKEIKESDIIYYAFLKNYNLLSTNNNEWNNYLFEYLNINQVETNIFNIQYHDQETIKQIINDIFTNYILKKLENKTNDEKEKIQLEITIYIYDYTIQINELKIKDYIYLQYEDYFNLLFDNIDDITELVTSKNILLEILDKI